MHIQPAIGRIRAGIPIENPLLEDIQNRYDEIYQACTAGCISLSASYGLPSFPPSEVGFISIYFSMALDRRAKLARRISVIIVCPTGIGSSRLLAENLHKAYVPPWKQGGLFGCARHGRPPTAEQWMDDLGGNN